MSEAGATTGREFAFTCPLIHGFHARPASQLAELAGRFAAESTIENSRNGNTGDMKSVLAIIAADIRHGDSCVVRIHGADEQAASAAIGLFVEQQIHELDEIASLPESSRAGVLPRGLRDLPIPALAGQPASPGIAEGRLVISGGLVLPESLRKTTATSAKDENSRLSSALALLRAEMEETLRLPQPAGAAAILKAHLAMTADPSLLGRMREALEAGQSAGGAVVEAGTYFMGLLRRSENAYTRERAVDIQELALRLLEKLYGPQIRTAPARLREASVVAADSLAPQQLLSFEREYLQGLVLEEAGATSHAVILARSLGIPVVVSAPNVTGQFRPGATVVVDGDRGLVLDADEPAVARFYERERETLAARERVLVAGAESKATTRDGTTIEVGANTASLEQLDSAFTLGADGVGLFRTEMLLMERDSLPSEEEQFETYAEVARRAAGKPVILRTFDIGGDKPVPCMELAKEANPFLGMRGVRLYREMPELFHTQIRAMLRAAAVGNLRVMIPMISTVEECRWVRSRIEEAEQELSAKALPFDADMQVGMMVEVPSAALLLDQLAEFADFFSIGTNDLSQYFFAADRQNPRVAALADVCDPAFLRLLQQIMLQARAHGKWVGMCGEMASDANCLPLLVGLGLDEISASGAQVPALKERARLLSAEECRVMLDFALTCSSASEVREQLKQARISAPALPLLDRSLVRLGSESINKDEAVRELLDLLYVSGRIEEREVIEEAVWQREAVYSTGLGFGVAVPHCKTDAVHADSIAVVGLREPLAWGAVDDQPVRLVILLAIREGGKDNRHLKVFSRLARRLMDEGFRQQLFEARDEDDLVGVLAGVAED